MQNPQLPIFWHKLTSWLTQASLLLKTWVEKYIGNSKQNAGQESVQELKMTMIKYGIRASLFLAWLLSRSEAQFFYQKPELDKEQMNQNNHLFFTSTL